MEFRVLQYFLAVAREQSISGAAEALHLSQPTLSRQLKDLEEELGKQLFIRGNRKITLTEEGILLRKRAEEITELMQKTESEISQSDDNVAGDITIGAAEAKPVRFLVQVAQALQRQYPLIRFHVISGDRATVMDQLDKGLIDFALLHGDVDSAHFESHPVPYHHIWGILMRRDSPLAAKEAVTKEDLRGQPMIISRQIYQNPAFQEAFKNGDQRINVVATYNLLYNGSLMVEEGMGYALCFDQLINTAGDSQLCFRPLVPESKIGMSLIWKRYQIFSKAAQAFLQKVKEEA